MKRTIVLMIGLLALAGVRRPARAQEAATQPAPVETTTPAEISPQPAPQTQPAAPPWRLLEVDLLELQLEFEMSYDQRNVRYDQRQRFQQRQWQRNSAWRFEELLGVHTTGNLIDEKLLLYDIMVRGGLYQESFDETGPFPDRHESPHGGIFEYDINLTLFPRGKLSGTAYAQNLQSRVPRAFQPSLDRTLERYGVGMFYNDAKLPMRFEFEHAWDELTSRTDNLMDDEKRGHDQFRYEATWQIEKNHSLKLTYEYEDRHERYSGTKTRYDTSRNYLTLQHLLRFGERDQSSWETIARLQDEDGELGRDEQEFSTRLRLRHNDWLSTNYAFQYLTYDFQGLATQTWRGEVGATVKLNEALTANLQLYGLQQQAAENADWAEFGGLASVSYSQENELGRLSANVSYNHNQIQTRDGKRAGVVIGESVLLKDPLPSFLQQVDVNRWSIVVTDADRTRTYVPGRDYLISQVGHYTALRRIASGEIVDRQTVLVSYTYAVQDNYTIQRDRLDFRIQQAFKFGLTPYYAGSIQAEDLDRADLLAYRGRNVNRHRIGLTYQQKKWSAGFEYEYNDDGIDPYQAIHANGDIILYQTAKAQLDSKAMLSRFWFDGTYDLEERNATLLDLSLSYRHLLARDLQASVNAMYRFEDDSIAGQTQGVDLSTTLEWRLGLFSVLFEAEYDALNLPDSRDDGFSVWLKLRRDIPIISRKPQ